MSFAPAYVLINCFMFFFVIRFMFVSLFYMFCYLFCVLRVFVLFLPMYIVFLFFI